MTLNQIWRMIVAARWTILVCTLACLLGALTFALRQPKTYEARARVLLQVAQPDPVTGVGVNSKTVDTYVRTQALLAVSSRVTELTADKLGWADNPAVVESWMAATGGTGTARQWAGQIIQSNMIAYALEGGGSLEIVYHAPDPDAARAIVGIIRESYIETSLALQNEAAARRAARFDVLTADARKRLEEAEKALAEEQRAAGMVVSSTGNDIERGKLDRLGAQALTVRQMSTRRDAGTAHSILTESLSVTLRRRLNGLDEDLSLAGTQLGLGNPTYQSMLARRKELVAQIAAADASARQNAGSVTQFSVKDVSRADAEYRAEFARVLAGLPTESRIKQALRMMDLRRGEYSRLLENGATERMLSTRSESGLVVMGDVIPNPKPVAPDLPVIGGLALVFGLGLGLMAAMVQGLSAREVLGKEDLAFASGVEVLAVVPTGPRRASRLRRWLDRRRDSARRPGLATT